MHKPNTFRLHIETKSDLGIELDYVYTGEDCDLKFIDLNVNKLEQKIQDKVKACCDRQTSYTRFDRNGGNRFPKAEIMYLL